MPAAYINLCGIGVGKCADHKRDRDKIERKTQTRLGISTVKTA